MTKKNYFIGHLKLITEALKQRGQTTWTIDRKDLPNNESMDVFCNSLIKRTRVNWTVDQASLLTRTMV